MHRSLRFLFSLALVAFLAPNAFSQCVSGTSTAELMTDGPHAGLWKYCVDFAWDTAHGLSNVILDFDFPCAGDVCDATWTFDDPAGSVDGVASDSGTPGECTVDLMGHFTCSAIPGLGLVGPLVKWDAISTIDPPCEPGMTGSGMACYYTDLPPSTDQSPMFIVKAGVIECQGMITGDFPSCPVGANDPNWSTVKKLYRD